VISPIAFAYDVGSGGDRLRAAQHPSKSRRLVGRQNVSAAQFFDQLIQESPPLAHNVAGA
jgi:hypothetical protein